MATSDRPSGLTALAVINFILAFMQGLGVLGLLFDRYLNATRAHDPDHMPDAELQRLQDLAEVSTANIVLLAVLIGISGVLLFITAFGYLRRKRFWGRILTNAYVVNDLTYVVCILTLMPGSYVKALGISLIRTVFYPLFLGGVINTIFRRDLVR